MYQMKIHEHLNMDWNLSFYKEITDFIKYFYGFSVEIPIHLIHTVHEIFRLLAKRVVVFAMKEVEWVRVEDTFHKE